jgi:DNA/RNA-binding domain of Phe-tRNA-synthetase-like protein
VRQVESELRQRFANADRATLARIPHVEAYQRHYRSFGQTYHVLRQLETVAVRSRPLASPSALVLAMFAVELQTLLLTAGHDLEAVRPPLSIDCSSQVDRFTGIGGQEQALRPNDMLMRDREGIISAVVYGPDQRTRLRETTRSVLFTTYAPDGISDKNLGEHMDQLLELVGVVSPAARVTFRAIQPPR